MERNDYYSRLASQFSTEVLNIVYRSRNIPVLEYTHCSSYSSIGKLVVSLIKGELRHKFCCNTLQVLERRISHVGIKDILMRVPRLFVEDNPCECTSMIILKAIAFTAMYSIYYYDYRNVAVAQAYAHNSITDMLLKLEDGQFIQRGGLVILTTYVNEMFRNQPELIRVIREGTYPW